MLNIDNKTILITGGSGSFGRKFIEITLRDYPGVKKIIVYSRDEMKHLEMMRLYPEKQFPQLRFFVGDVRDEDRLLRACEGVDVLIHAASLMTLEASEYNPDETIKTNIAGAQNVIDCALKCGIRNVIALSSDKACSPASLYGASQLVSDKLFVAANNITGGKDIHFSVIRYGNVMGSKGSVFRFFMERAKIGGKELPVTDKRMTRFLISNQQVVDMVYYVIEKQLGGEIFVPKMPSYRITDLAVAIAPKMEIKEVGKRPGEKLYDDIIAESDAENTLEARDFYVVIPFMSYSKKRSIEEYQDYFKATAVPEGFHYSSNTNTMFETIETLREKIRRYIDYNFKAK
ncbi:MAG: UDP-N-acetylglucosamine 4,6-dehydratase (inverting) [Prevotella sp.]|nr:UDP-N-acetylglucosamine 4,6-dehydratase (inverting) [Prevotella sp.]